METTAKRTLVKSAPELWELADDEGRMQVWMAELMGATGTIAVEVTDREPERLLAWQTAHGGPFGRIAVDMAEKGFGTAVVITAHRQGAESGAGAALENLLDELGSPERQPFARG